MAALPYVHLYWLSINFHLLFKHIDTYTYIHIILHNLNDDWSIGQGMINRSADSPSVCCLLSAKNRSSQRRATSVDFPTPLSPIKRTL